MARPSSIGTTTAAQSAASTLPSIFPSLSHELLAIDSPPTPLAAACTKAFRSLEAAQDNQRVPPIRHRQICTKNAGAAATALALLHTNSSDQRGEAAAVASPDEYRTGLAANLGAMRSMLLDMGRELCGSIANDVALRPRLMMEGG